MDDPFESAWQKWAWAVVNANALGRDINAFAAQANLKMPMRLMKEYDAKRHCIVLSIDKVENPFPAEWGLGLGDAVHNFRSAVDHVAWALYKRGATPNLRDSLERNVSFPISDDRVKFNRSLERKLPGVTRTDIALVRRCQPYRAGKRNLRRHVLLVLDELSRKDKHRAIRPVVPVPEQGAFAIEAVQDCIYRRFKPSTRGALQPGTELGRFYLKKTGPDPDIDVEPRFTLDPALDEFLSIQEFLTKTISAIRILLRLFSEPPESATAMVGNPIP